MPSSEFNYSNYTQFAATASTGVGTFATLAKKAVRSFYSTQELTTNNLIAYYYLPPADYFKNFYSWNPKNLDDMRTSIMGNATTPTFLVDVYDYNTSIS